jgi:hypothetical protein
MQSKIMVQEMIQVLNKSVNGTFSRVVFDGVVDKEFHCQGGNVWVNAILVTM